MNEPPQYDALIGGKQELPQVLNITNHATHRYNEMRALEQVIQTVSGTKLIFQRLPRHMRRRAMSYNIKRLPRLVRKKYASQLEKSGTPQTKRCNRKYRRRPYNLQNDYMLRQTKIHWLDTHIWHAKRFFMINRWGYRLPYSPCDKAFRACYRATTQHCLIQDISYLTCIELTGPVDELIAGLRRTCEPSFGLGITAKAFIRGNREGSTILLDINTRKVIGPVTFMWNPQIHAGKCSVWIWTHPAFSSAVTNNFTECFCLGARNLIKIIYTNELTGVRMVHKSNLNRFRLTGPLSNILLHRALTECDFKESGWLNDYLEHKGHLSSCNEQINYWNKIRDVSASCLTPHMILPLIVNDPRVNFPRIRTKAMLNQIDTNVDSTPLSSRPISPLWTESYYKQIKESKVSNEKIAQIRSGNLVPDETNQLLNTPIPIILIQRPGNKTFNQGYASGWDVIIPSGWAQPFWLSFVLWGGRSGGLRETEMIELESGNLPLFMPDTSAGKIEENRQTQIDEEKFFRLPPNKRPNYMKFGIVEPFSFKWENILMHWKVDNSQNFSVIRNFTLLGTLQRMLSKQSSKEVVNFDQNAFVPVRLKVTKGTVRKYALITLPTLSDLNNPRLSLQEPLRRDPNQNLRKELRTEYRTLVKRYKQRRKRAKLLKKAINIDYAHLTATREKIKSLWLPKTTEECKTTACRDIMGLITNGNFSLTHGYCCAVGFIALKSLQSLLNLKTDTVLVRNNSSRQYHLAKLEIIV